MRLADDPSGLGAPGTNREAEMRKNMGKVDRWVRFILAVVIAVLYFTGTISGAAAIILGIVAIAFFATSLAGSCPAYLPMGISTKKKEE